MAEILDMKRVMSKYQTAIRLASERYLFDFPFIVPMKTSDGRPLREKFLPRPNRNGYPVISTRIRKLGISMQLQVHQIVGYQKFGESIFVKGYVCRHKNNNKLDFSYGNILLGTHLENHKDNPDWLNIRISECAKKAGIARRVIDFETLRLMKLDRSIGMFYGDIAKKYGHKKSTAYYAVTGRTYNSEDELEQPLSPIANGCVA